ncbi:MAG: sigma-70 family RNA polymerase sigma factor [Planctomycetes bacterium]|nr:sigma-70 family RNA polymerase sigma factor [Planctomycetota bacterium]
MDYSVQPDPQRLLAEARAGHRGSLGVLLERYRAYLGTQICSQIGLHLQARANPSDVVQEAFLLASRHFDRFRGTSEREWLHWLRRIVRRCLLRLVRKHVRARRRSVQRELSLDRNSIASGAEPVSPKPQIASHGSSPSSTAQRRELAGMVAERLARLSPAHRDVLVLRNLKSLSFDDVARQMGRSPGAVRVLWLRALDQLRRQRINEDWL